MSPQVHPGAPPALPHLSWLPEGVARKASIDIHASCRPGPRSTVGIRGSPSCQTPKSPRSWRNWRDGVITRLGEALHAQARLVQPRDWRGHHKCHPADPSHSRCSRPRSLPAPGTRVQADLGKLLPVSREPGRQCVPTTSSQAHTSPSVPRYGPRKS